MEGNCKVGWFGRYVNAASRSASSITAASIMLMMLMITFEVIGRRLFGFSIFITFEVTGYVIVAMAFLTLAENLRTDSHIRITVVTDKLSRRVRYFLDWICTVSGLAFSTFLTWQYALLVMDSYSLGAVSPEATRIAIYLPQLIMPVGAALLILMFIVKILVLLQPTEVAGS